MTRVRRRSIIRYSVIAFGIILCLVATILVVRSVRTHQTFERLKHEAARIQSVTGVMPSSFNCSTGSVNPQCTAHFENMNLRHVENMLKRTGYSFTGVSNASIIQADNSSVKTRVEVIQNKDAVNASNIQLNFKPLVTNT